MLRARMALDSSYLGENEFGSFFIKAVYDRSTSCVKPSRQECRTDLTIQGQTRFTLAKSEVCCDQLNRKQATSSHEALLLLTSLVNPSIG